MLNSLLIAFFVGGTLCLAAQLVLDLSNLTPAHVMVLFVCLGAVASAAGLYAPLVKFAGAGASVPLPAFGHIMVQGMLKEMGVKGWIGLLTGGLTAAAMGLSAAVLFSSLMALLFNPRG